MKSNHRLHFAAALVAIVSLAGCADRGASEVAERNSSNIQRLTNVYTSFQAGRFGVGPKDEAELKTFIKAEAADRLKMMGIDPTNLDAIWVSDRDHRPFKVRYGTNRGAAGAIVFEQEGVGGKKQVCFTGGSVEEVDDKRYSELWEGKGSARPASEGAPPTADAAKKQ